MAGLPEDADLSDQSSDNKQLSQSSSSEEDDFDASPPSEEDDESVDMMVQIMEPTSNSGLVAASVEHENFKKVIELERKYRKVPYVVISIGGVKRSGKSFLMNLMVHYLQHRAKNAEHDWLDDKAPVAGVSWSWNDDMTALTHGVRMWPEPFVITHNDKKVAVLLMDTQGLFDSMTNGSLTKDAMVTSFVLNLSKIHLLNLKGVLNANDLAHLEDCLAYCNFGETASVLDTLFLVFRDWNNRTSLGIFQGSPQKLKTKREKRAYKAFKDCWNARLPSPGDRIKNGQVKDGRKLQELKMCHDSEEVDKASESFLSHVKKLFDKLFIEMAFDKKYQHESQTVLLQCLETAVSILGRGESFESHTDILERSRVGAVYTQLMTEEFPQYCSAVDPKKCGKLLALENEILVEAEKAGKYISSKMRKLRAESTSTASAWRDVDAKIYKKFCKMREQKVEEFFINMGWDAVKNYGTCIAAGMIATAATIYTCDVTPWNALAATDGAGITTLILDFARKYFQSKDKDAHSKLLEAIKDGRT